MTSSKSILNRFGIINCAYQGGIPEIITLSGIAPDNMDCICGRNPYDRYFGRCLPDDNFRTLLYVFGKDSLLKRAQPKFTTTKIEIGVSKACCEWCCQYLNLLASAYLQHSILVRASHGKQPDGWMMPPNGPKSIAKQMIQSIEGRVDDVIWEIKNRRRSDSNELPSFMKKNAGLRDEKEDITENRLDFDMSDT